MADIIFIVVVMVTIILGLIYLVVTAIYTFNLYELKVPTTGESIFMFWVAIILMIIFISILIWAIIKLVMSSTKREEVCEIQEKKISTTPTTLAMLKPSPKPPTSRQGIPSPVPPTTFGELGYSPAEVKAQEQLVSNF